MRQKSINRKVVAKTIDNLIHRGLHRVETEGAATTIVEYIRLLQLCPEMQQDEDDAPEVIWVDDLDNFKWPEAA